MVKFRPRRVDRSNNNTPIVSNYEIDMFAQAVLRDYKPSLLRKPDVLNHEHFLESYLGMRIEFADIFTEDEERPILAMTAFANGQYKIFDYDNDCTSLVPVEARTVIFDNVLSEPEKETVARFSGLHEGGHILMHGRVYGGEDYGGYDDYGVDDEFTDDGDGDFIDEDVGEIDFGEKVTPIVCCRRENIENFGGRKKKLTAAEWREHHADYFAAA